ncbi:YitT family protein [Gorillibacterium sp. sgz5001074]|uniref:YitT family protein n=1 Tax=Gorillibacterium sp. sgz5001074 TaxID=3446695 RepID=UPI003F679DD3
MAQPRDPNYVNTRKREPAIKKGTPAHYLYEYTLLVAGSLLIALSFNLFLKPNQVASGGVTGISVIVLELFGFNTALTQWALNIPLFLLGLLFLGKQFGLKTAVGSFVLPLFVLITQHLEPLTHNLLLATIYGGIGIGVGLGIVFRGRGSTGGLDLAAQLVHRLSGISLGIAVAMLDGLVILTAGLVFDAEKALFALIGLYVTSKTIDVVQLGFGYAKVAYIISEEAEAITEAILHDLDRGLTRLNGAGGYTGTERTVLMVVVSQTEVSRLKELVRNVDPSAFVIISETREVLGEGFKLHT